MFSSVLHRALMSYTAAVPLFGLVCVQDIDMQVKLLLGLLDGHLLSQLWNLRDDLSGSMPTTS